MTYISQFRMIGSSGSGLRTSISHWRHWRDWRWLQFEDLYMVI